MSLGYEDEVMLRDPYHPLHRNGEREGKRAFGFCLILFIIFWLIVEVSWLPMAFKVIISLAVSSLVGFIIAKKIKQFANKTIKVTDEEFRETLVAERKKQIAELKVSEARKENE